MSQINILINKEQPNFATWERQLSEHMLLQYEPEAVETEENKLRIFYQTNELLAGIAQSFFSYGKFKDDWNTSKCAMFPFGQHLLLHSKKMDVVFHWGVEMNDFYLEASLVHAENMRFMTDEFWRDLLELKTLGKFEYSGGGGLDSRQKPYFENKTSTVFQLIRTFMINQTEVMNDGNCQWEYGNLTLRWEMDNNWQLLLEQACKAFRLMYELNYGLWKVHDRAQKKRR